MDVQVVGLPDGRRLELAAFGARDGAVVLYLHGLLGSPARPCPVTDRMLAELGLRYVMVSRPGFGRSTPHRGRTLRSFAGDVAAAGRVLGWQRLTLLGMSAGAPYAAACAALLGPELVTRAGLVSSPAPLDRRVAAAAAARLATRLGATSRAIADDLRVLLAPWDVELGAIDVPVLIWHGLEDALVPVAHAFELARTIPNARLAIAADGHFFFRRHVPEILGALTAAPTLARSAG